MWKTITKGPAPLLRPILRLVDGAQHAVFFCVAESLHWLLLLVLVLVLLVLLQALQVDAVGACLTPLHR